jgi:hypothetical protein
VILFREAVTIHPAPIHTTFTAIAVSWMKPLMAINFRTAVDPHDNMAGETNVRQHWPTWL